MRIKIIALLLIALFGVFGAFMVFSEEQGSSVSMIEHERPSRVAPEETSEQKATRIAREAAKSDALKAKIAEEQSETAKESKAKAAEEAKRNARTEASRKAKVSGIMAGGNSGGSGGASRSANTPKTIDPNAAVSAQIAAIAKGLESEDAGDDELAVLTSKKWTAARIKKRFAARGKEEPKRILTELSGKVMVHGIRTGLPNARVVLHSFFPESNRPTDQLIPVVTEFTTDAKGFFTGKVPLPERYPEGHPVLTISVVSGADGGRKDLAFKGKRASERTWSFAGKEVVFDGRYGAGQPLVIAKALTKVVAGKKTALGIFWVSDHTANLEAIAKGAAEDSSLRLYQVGHLFPKRWTETTRMETLNFFPNAILGQTAANMLTVTADPIGLSVTDGPPRMAVTENGELADVQVAYASKGRTAKEAGEESLLRSPLDDREYKLKVSFALGGGEFLSGYVQSVDKIGIPDASISVFCAEGIYYGRSDAGGAFNILVKSEVRYVTVQHSDWVNLGVSNAGFKMGDALVMRSRRTEIAFQVVDSDSLVPIENVRLTFDAADYTDNAGRLRWKKGLSQDLARVDESMLFQYNGVINKVTLSADGYTAKEITLPKEEPLAGEIALVEVKLEGRRKIEVAPKDYSEAKSRGDSKWFSTSDSDDVYTAWSHLDLSYDVNFSREDLATEEEQEAVPFELVLGLRNQGIVDNVYDFQVDVLIDGKRKGRLTIRADTINERFGSINLGKLKGVRRITLRWLNDKWIPNELDANIRVCSLRFLEIK